VLPTPETINYVNSERRVPPGVRTPFVVLADEDAGPARRNRRLVLRFPAATQFTVRAGSTNRSVDIVMAGKGALVSTVPAAEAAPVRTAPATSAPATPETEAQAKALFAQARAAMDRADYAIAIARLDDLLALPPNSLSQQALETIALARWREGDPQRARAEFETYLKLYPSGPGADRAREALLTLAPPPIAAPGAMQPGTGGATTTLAGSVSSFYYGGQSKLRTQDFQDSPLGGVPQLLSDATLSGTDQKQVLSSADLNWRRRDADSDLRLVVRDTYTSDLLRSDRSHNRLYALYADYRLQSPGLSLRVGRQSPLGGGVMGRFDGIDAGWRFAPKWRVNVVAGQPTDKLLDTRRRFWGLSVDTDAIAPNFGATLYGIEQTIDGQVDRRAVGTELRYVQGGLSATSMFDYDVVLHGLNIASVQGTWQWPDNTVVNALYDRRSTPMLMLGNSLFFQNPVLAVQATKLEQLLASQAIGALREQVRATTSYTTQAMLGVTHPVTPKWQVGVDVRLTNVGALLPVPDILPFGQPGTGNVWAFGAQVIGTNLYSARDTHVVLANVLRAPTYHGTLFQYNNSSAIGGRWLVEPSLRLYQQRDNTGTLTRRWGPGVRATWRALPKLAWESEVDLEFGNVTGPLHHETSRRLFFYTGLRYDF
jgi:hypothetical protein